MSDERDLMAEAVRCCACLLPDTHPGECIVCQLAALVRAQEARIAVMAYVLKRVRPLIGFPARGRRQEEEMLSASVACGDAVQDDVGRGWLAPSEGAALRARIAELTEWRPMETAPRDGTAILACDREGPVIIWWSSAVPGATACGPRDEWRWARGAVDCAYPPLGWLPLPAIPKAEVGE